MDDAWTTGGDANLEHIRFIAVGGFAQVHEVFCIPYQAKLTTSFLTK